MPTTDNLVLAVLAMLDLDDFSKNYCDMKNAEKNPTLGTYIKELKAMRLLFDGNCLYV